MAATAEQSECAERSQAAHFYWVSDQIVTEILAQLLKTDRTEIKIIKT